MNRKSLIIALIVGGTFFMENLDSTAITTAIPKMAQDFSVDPVTMSMGITSYVIMLAVFIPISGWFAERFGTRNIFSIAIAGFTISSALCGLSYSLPLFIGARILQGIFGALMVPVGRLAVLSNTEKKDLVTTIAYLSWPGLAGPICGPFLGGFFTTYFTWHWIFFVNVPLGIIAIFLTYKYIPKSNHHYKRKFDWVGFLLSGIGLLALMIGVEITSETNVNIPVALSLIAVALLLIGISVWHSFRIQHPIIDYAVMKVRTYKVIVTSGTVTKIVINTAPYVLPLFFQIGFGLSAFNAGLLYMASMVGNLAMKPATIWITRKFNFKAVLIVNGLLLALAVFLQSFLQPDTPYWLMATLLFFSGLTRSMQFSSMNALAYADIDAEEMSNANTLNSTLRQVALAAGISIGALLLHLSANYHGNGSNYQVEDFQLTLQIIAIIGVLAIYDFFTIKKTDALNVRNKKA
ncbi:drug resistance transporter, EmrB/QacA subfamily [Pustulibacterium marinum]|uniref:Drug resistance transporter, EmrB/QacA subfamily n=1 Tax=Pustulibacterium marinum TaxID=1224947 RepID=A0A1I7G3T9_9FLAO|nr:DHA2 family efflux MFS transporter permease subunit [Pustulibacterium marinum]SFU43119.1 drug resistance transporter, EmrB/QacA subfamily [Pustulibacterium marinum]